MVGHRIKELRLEAGISARALSRLSGLASAGHVASIEGGSGARPETLSAIARVLGTSLDWLVDGKGSRPTARAVRAAVERARAPRAA
ncbi:MAG: helix-turn-helix transcriptional regulator [Labilithrix sp.]|nr:helix-turn-helix transcriptional regulator [Labilithrix sp.]